MNLVFFGNHTVGCKVLSILFKRSNIKAVIAHPEDLEDGVRYESVYEYAVDHNIFVVRGKPTDKDVLKLVTNAKPDLIVVADYRYLLPESILTIPKHGVINLHPSLLPKYRGRAPLNWAIINGEKEFGLTAHYVTKGMDNGDIIGQESFQLDINEDVSDALSKLYPIYEYVTGFILEGISSCSINRRPQKESESTYFPARKPEDGKINWDQSSHSIVNLIRAVTHPYPGAFTFINKSKVMIWKASIINIDCQNNAGKIINIIDNKPIVRCKDKCVRLDNYEVCNHDGGVVEVGNIFN